jgi:hypothetical protein
VLAFATPRGSPDLGTNLFLESLKINIRFCGAAALPDCRAAAPPHLPRSGPTGVQLTCTRGDGRLISWLIEVWIHPNGPNDWSANVKAEIDLDDRNDDDCCILKRSTGRHRSGCRQRRGQASCRTRHQPSARRATGIGLGTTEWVGDEPPP